MIHFFQVVHHRENVQGTSFGGHHGSWHAADEQEGHPTLPEGGEGPAGRLHHPVRDWREADNPLLGEQEQER